MPDISGGIRGIGGAVSSFYNSEASKAMAAGYGASADLFGDAAQLARKNARLTEKATAIQLTQADRQIYKVISGQQSDVSGAGFSASGTALDLLRDSTAQGELTMDLIKKQGHITAAGYEQQALSFMGQRRMALAQESAAYTSAEGSMISGMINGVSALAAFAL